MPNEYKPKIITRTCEKCGNTFQQDSADYVNHNIQPRRFCSSKCRTLAKHLNLPAICDNCGEGFTKNHSKTKWCSPRCAQQHHQKVTNRRQIDKRREDKYKMSPGQYKRMLGFQCGVCAICGQQETNTRNGVAIRLAIDHCHKTGRNRSLLCARCNMLLGNLEDNFALIDNFIEYLQYHGFRTQGPELGYMVPVPKLYNPDALT